MPKISPMSQPLKRKTLEELKAEADATGQEEIFVHGSLISLNPEELYFDYDSKKAKYPTRKLERK